MTKPVEQHPIQSHKGRLGAGKLNAAVTKIAAEVYDHLYPGQPLTRINERGGYETGEVIAFLYARNFPKAEWGMRVEEAFLGMENI